MSATEALPTDDYSRTLARLLDNPASISSSSTIDAVTFLGNSETWVIKTVRVDGLETLFLQVINADGGRRFVLPPAVSAALTRQRDQVLSVSRRRAARAGVATRKAKATK